MTQVGCKAVCEQIGCDKAGYIEHPFATCQLDESM